MTKKTSKPAETETPTPEATPAAEVAPEAAAPEAADADSEDDEEEDEDEDEDEEKSEDDDEKDEKKDKKKKEKKEKKDKVKKVEVEFEASMPRTEAISYFEAIIGGLRSGRLEFKQSGDALVLTPPDQLEVEVTARLKGDKAKIVFEIAWSNNQRALEILN